MSNTNTINIVPLANVYKILLDNAARLSESRALLLTMAGNLSQTVAAIREGDLAIKAIDLTKTPLDPSLYATEVEALDINIAYAEVVKIADMIRDALNKSVFLPRPPETVKDPA